MIFLFLTQALTYQLSSEIFQVVNNHDGSIITIVTKNGNKINDFSSPLRTLVNKYPDRIKVGKFRSDIGLRAYLHTQYGQTKSWQNIVYLEKPCYN